MTRDITLHTTPPAEAVKPEQVTPAAPAESLPSTVADSHGQTGPGERAYSWLLTPARWLLVALALVAVGWLSWNARLALLPFALGLVLAYLLLPVVNTLARHMPRALAVLIVYVVGIALIVGIIAYVLPPVIVQIQQLASSIPPLSQLQEIGTELLQQYQSRVPESIRQPINEGLDNALRSAQANLSLYVQQVGGFIFAQVLQVINTVAFLVGFFIVPIWLFYVLNDQAQGRSFIDRMLHPRLRADFWNIWSIVNKVLSNYVRGQFILCAAIGAMIGIGLVILQLVGFHIKYTLLLALLSAMTELIPVVGQLLGAIPAVLLALFVSPATALAVALVYIVVQQIENNFLVPRVMGESVGIHPAILTVILIAMGYTFGLLGVLLAAPVSAIARDLFLYAYRRLNGIRAADALASVVAASPRPRRKIKPSRS